ncbi:hypothetical protein [Rhodopirellula sallentina]|uniref:Putative membrane protein n=1 Tax=Rhodopirellula sallentina SM41 TaxID=1263870 RepID=M5UF63_9BACT|nr:hypothetical protein [Rhodopirellula sallentina]EMI54628.1 putative membrane protein [Rhodopirellula sallentina SM41]
MYQLLEVNVVLDRNPTGPFDDSSLGESGTRGNSPTTLGQFVRLGQLLSFALASGIVTTSAVFLFLILQREPDAEQPNWIFLAIGGGVFVASLVVSFLMRLMLKSNAASALRQTPEAEDVCGGGAAASQSARDAWENWDADEPLPRPLIGFLSATQTSRLIAQAVLEGAAMINLVFTMLDGNVIHFVFAAFCLVGVIAITPTTGKVRSEIRSALTVGGVSGEDRF